ncbi:MAG TPA: DUF6443 domain-containing protein, partial [Chitinophagaceae bacterium]|nr:DUF6443 domain-containing protein [Chitinophagaceae bacterium]
NRDKKVAIRRAVTISGVPSEVYSLPQQFWKTEAPVFYFTYYYKSADFENRNYIRENVVLTRGIDRWEDADLLASDKKMQTTTYLDGLSRPVQVVGKGTHYDENTNQWYDMVQSITYEAGGRVDKALMPYPTTENSGKFKTNVATAQSAYYQSKFGENNAYSKVEYDNSPQNRVKKAFAPGDSWVGNNVSVSGDVEVFFPLVDKVRKWEVGYTAGAIPVSVRTYTNELNLIKTWGKDEKNKKVLSYTDLNGNLVLKKVQLADGDSLTNEHQGWLCTYYVYDDYNQLRFIITPKAVKEAENNNWVLTQDMANELCYWYDYDDLGRAVAKKSPGKNAEYFVYDRKNRPVFTQDAGVALSEPGNPILATLYDDLNRPVMTGLLYGRTITEWQTFSNADPTTITTVSTAYGGTIKIQGSPLTVSEINNPAVFKQLSFNYYDNYTYTGAKTFNAAHTNNLAYKNASSTGNVESNSLTKRYTGMMTGVKTRVMDGNSSSPVFLLSSVFYDEEGRGIQSQTDNIKGGVEITSSQYHFDGRLLSSIQTHNGNGTPFTNFSILNKYKFDKIGRVVAVGKKINNASRNYVASVNVPTTQEDDDAGYKMTVAIKYNELNRVVKKTLSPNYNNNQGIETLDYTYNLRGWLTGINKDYALGEYNSDQWQHFFGMYLGYDNRDGKFAAPQYNGSLTGVQWKSQGDNTPRKFDYEYDNAGRLMKSTFNQRGNNTEGWNRTKVDFSTKDITYDENGNLLTMTQMGIVAGGATPVIVDNLSYQYLAKSNKLRSVTDNAGSSANGKLGDFKDGTNTSTDDYSYDANGRLVMDNNKSITGIVYNYLDKPERIWINQPNKSGNIRYIYSAGGSKIQKITTENPSASNGNQQRITTTTYIGAYVYEQVTVAGTAQPEALQMIQHGEGRIRIITPYNNPADPANIISGGIDLPGGKQGVFDYFIRDNLGNVRATITEEVNKAAGVCTMEDANPSVKQSEEATFGNPGTNNEVNSTRITKPSAWNANTSAKVSKLQASGGVVKIGPNAFLKVMAGDKIRAKTDYYYQTDPGTGGNTLAQINGLVTGLAAALAGGRTAAVTHGNEAAISSNLNINPDVADMFNNPPPGSSPNANAPRAYLNYIFFDEQFNFVKEVSGFKRVSQSGDGAPVIVTDEVKAVKNGYVYVYLSNESNEPVYFDNFSVSHERGRLVAEDHYYSYGLKIASIS